LHRKSTRDPVRAESTRDPLTDGSRSVLAANPQSSLELTQNPVDGVQPMACSTSLTTASYPVSARRGSTVSEETEEAIPTNAVYGSTQLQQSDMHAEQTDSHGDQSDWHSAQSDDNFTQFGPQSDSPLTQSNAHPLNDTSRPQVITV
jgi:hypothetical protein